MTLLLDILIVLFLSAFFAGTETVYTAFDRILAVSWSRTRKFGGSIVQFFAARPDRFLSTTLIGNSIANVGYSFLLVFWADANGIAQAWVIVLGPLVALLFCEIVPKTLGYAVANGAVRFVSLPLIFFYYLFIPVRMIIHPFVRLASRSREEERQVMGNEPFPILRELDQILVGAQEEGSVSPEEGEILTRYLDARELKARDIMTPRTEMIAVSRESTPNQVRDVFRRHLHAVLPVYEHGLDHIVGCIYARDALREFQSVDEVLRPVHMVPESKRLVDLLQDFKKGREQIAIVVDEYGGTDGLVTIKDVFEELVGAVAERWDPNEPVIKRLAPGRFLISGAAFLELVEAATGWSPPEGDYNTLSGLLSEHLGRIPDVGEEIELDPVTIRILRRTPRRVEGVLLTLNTRTPPPTESA